MFLRLWYWDGGGPVATPAPELNYYAVDVVATGRSYRAVSAGRMFGISGAARAHDVDGSEREFEVDATGRNWRVLH